LSVINNPDGGFRIYWRWVNSERQETPTSYQDYTVDGEKNGAQIDSIIQNTNEIFSHHGDTIRSGDTLYNLVGTANYSRDIEYMDESSTIRGDLEGVLLTRGDIYDAHLSRDRSYRSGRNLVTIASPHFGTRMGKDRMMTQIKILAKISSCSAFLTMEIYWAVSIK